MNSVIVTKQNLIKALEKNLEKHNVIYLEAIKGYWKELNGKLKKELVLANTKEKGVVNVSVHINAPEDRTKDYTNIISMAKAHIEEEIELDQHEFNAYFLNEWPWKQNFLTSNAFYVQGAMGPSGPTGDLANF